MSSASNPNSSSWSFRSKSTSLAASFASCSSRNSHACGTGWLKARNHAMAAPERPKLRTMVAAAAMGRIVQWRMRPRLLGSTMSLGRDALNSLIIALYSVSVMVPAVTDCLQMERVVLDMPVWLSSFQRGPDEPSMRPYSTASRWRWYTKRTMRLPAARRSTSETTHIVKPAPCSTRNLSTTTGGAAILFSLSLSSSPWLSLLSLARARQGATVTKAGGDTGSDIGGDSGSGRGCSHPECTRFCGPCVEGVVVVAFYGRFIGGWLW
mmetsp:Transcript_25615/g.58293  ORF Transcript_25615/g.58293 Transcript_25615/m.58293 type:complete len:266 (-) Transcript_25615:35-832(-)